MDYLYHYAVIIKAAEYRSDDDTTGYSPQRHNEAIYPQGGSRGIRRNTGQPQSTEASPSIDFTDDTDYLGYRL